MYIIIKNDKQALSSGLTAHTWKHLDECKEAAEQATEDTKATITVCELKPLYTYNLEIVCTENGTGEELAPPNNDEELDDPNTDEVPREPNDNDLPSPDDEETQE